MTEVSEHKKEPMNKDKEVPNGMIEEAQEENREHDALVGCVTSQLSRIIHEMTGYDTRAGLEIQSLKMTSVYSGWSEPRFLRWSTDFHVNTGDVSGNLSFFVKGFKGGQEAMLQRELELYRLMEGSGVVPRAFYWTELGNRLLLESAGEVTAEEKIFGLTEQIKQEIEDPIIRNIARFNLHAAENTARAVQSETLGQWLKTKKPSSLDAMRYFRDYTKALGIDISDEDIERFGDNYSTLISIYGTNGVQLVHGDLRRQNIVGPEQGEWNQDSIKIVDLGSMILGDPIFGLAQFVTSAGARAKEENIEEKISRWNHAINVYKTHEISLMGARGGRGIRILREARWKAQSRFYPSAVHYSFRGLSKFLALEKDSPEDYQRLVANRPVLRRHNQDMRRNIRVGLGYILGHPDNFNLSREQIERLRGLHRDFEKYEVLG